MAGADDYAKWIVDNADKKGTPEFDTVAQAYNAAKNDSGTSAKPYDAPTFAKRAMSFGQGLTFGFGDEIAGTLGADKERYRATLDQYAKDEPIGNGVSNLIGGIAGPSVLAAPKLLKRAIPALELLNKSPVLTAGGTGLLYGGMQSAGDSNGTDNLGAKMAEGGGIGAGLGLGMMGVMKGVSPVAGALANGAMSNMPGIGEKYAINLARNRVADAFNRDKMTIRDVAENMHRLGSEARFADAAGENTRGVLDLNANLPGNTKNDLENLIRARQASRPERLDDVVYAVNGGHGRAKDLTSALTKQQQDVSGPLYAQLATMDVAPTAQLIRDLEAAKKLGAWKHAENIALADPSNGPFTLGASQQSLGSGRIGVRDIDHIKRGIDSLIDGQTDAVTGKVTSQGRAFVALKNRITGEADTLTTDPNTGISVYAAARNAYAGPASLKSAITKGRSFWSDNAEGIDSLTEGMTQGEKEAFRVGASEKLRQMVGGQTGQNQLLNIWKERNTREKLQALLGDDVKYSQVEQMLKNEETLKRLESLGPSRNSRTFSREAGNDQQNVDNAADLVSAGVNLKTGGLSSLLPFIKNAATRAATPEPVRNGIGSILMGKYSTDEMKALQMAMDAIKARQRAAAVATGAIGGKTGNGLLND